MQQAAWICRLLYVSAAIASLVRPNHRHLRDGEAKKRAGNAAAERMAKLTNRLLESTNVRAAEKLNFQNVSNSTDSVLIFWAVKSSDAVMNLVMQNVDHLRESYHGRADVYLAHYDLQKDRWLQNHGEWYSQNIQFGTNRKGYKFQLAQALLTKPDMLVDMSAYEWVWVLDEDIDFTNTNMPLLFREASATGSLLVLPAFRELALDPSSQADADDGGLSYPFQEPNKHCRFRYVPMVEVIFPLIRPKALWQILTNCEHCIHPKTVWGLDRMWCSFSARMLGRQREQACAILDQTPVLHRNFRSLAGKYQPDGHLRTEFVEGGIADKKDVEKHHQEDFVLGAGDMIRPYSCIDLSGKEKVTDHMAKLRSLGNSFGWSAKDA
jgi:hypothetical protein